MDKMSDLEAEELPESANLSEKKQRGRPKVSPEKRQSERIVISLTPDEFRAISIMAANHGERPLQAREFVRLLVIKEINKCNEP